MKFLVDAQLPPALADWLRKAGHEAQHVQDVTLRDADDAAIRVYAARTGAVLMTKDRDFIPPVQSQEPAIQVVWVRTGNTSTHALLERIEAAWSQLMGHLEDGVELVELR